MTWRKRVSPPCPDDGMWNSLARRKRAAVEVFKAGGPVRLGDPPSLRRQGYHRVLGMVFFQWGHGDLFKEGMMLTLKEAS